MTDKQQLFVVKVCVAAPEFEQVEIVSLLHARGIHEAMDKAAHWAHTCGTVFQVNAEPYKEPEPLTIRSALRWYREVKKQCRAR